MVTRLKPISLMTVLAAMSLAGCGLYDSEKIPPQPDSAQLNFEGDQFATWNAAGAFVAADDAVTGGSQGITFSRDTAQAKWGYASLKISGTMQKNAYGPDFISDARIYLNSDKAAVDFSGKTITVNFLVQTGTADKVQIILNDSSARPCQGKYTDYAAKDGWKKVDFKPGDTAQRNYCDAAFDITKVAQVEVRVANTAATAAAAPVVWNVDTISWAGTAPPPSSDFTDTKLLVNGDFEGDNTDRWGIYDNAKPVADNGFSGGTPVACTADGFTGNCLKATAAYYIGTDAQTYDSGVYLNDGTGATPSNNLFLNLTPGTYKVAFKAKASQAAKVKVVVQTSNYQNNPLDQDLVLDASLKAYESQTFVVAAAVTLRFGVQLGFSENAGATLEFDEFKLLKKN